MCAPPVCCGTGPIGDIVPRSGRAAATAPVTESQNPRIPRLVEGADYTQLRIEPMEGFVLSRIDGVMSCEDIADLTGVDLARVQAVMDRMFEAGVVEWGTLPERQQRLTRGATPSGGVVHTKPPPPDVSRVLYDPQEIEEPDLDIDPERRRLILDTFYRLGELSFYDLLDVDPSSDRKEIRAAYFKQSKLFHPDTMFGKRLGSYKAKMEGVFKQLTDAYEVLGKKDARAEYDAYLNLRVQTQAAQRSLAEGRRAAERLVREATEAAGRAVVVPEPKEEPTGPEPEAATAVESPVPAPPEDRTGSESGRPGRREEARLRARELMARKIAAATGRAMPSGRPSSRPPASPPPPDGGAAHRDVLLRGLARSLRQAASFTGGLDRTQRYLNEATEAEAKGNLVAATNALRLAVTLAPDRRGLVERYESLNRRLAVSLADTYEKQARYEERNRRWPEAALSWSKVCEGKPTDPSAHMWAARALLEAGKDLSRAKVLAERAVELQDGAEARAVLGRVFLAAGMELNARRELEIAATLDPGDQMVENLLRQLNKRTP